MNRRNVILAVAFLLMVGIVVGFVVRASSGPPADRILVAGDVRDVVRTIAAPASAYPTASFSVQVPSDAKPGVHVAIFNQRSITASQSLWATRTAGVPVLSGTVTAADVRVGDHVATGAVLAQLDTSLLDLGVQQARLNATAVATTVRVLNNGIDTIIDNQDKLATGKAQLATGKAQLATGKAQLATAKATLLKAKAGLLAAQEQLLAAKRGRPQLEATLAILKQKAATFPPGHVPAALQAQIAGLEKLLASIDPGLAKIAANLAQVEAGLAKLATAEAQLAAGAAKLATAAGQLATASKALHTAKKQAIKARDYVRIIADNADVGIVLAQAARTQATIVSPVSGTITLAPAKGSVVVVGAPLTRIRPDGAALVDTYVSGDRLALLHLGTLADITFDSGAGRTLSARLYTIGSDVEYPPTNFSTDIVHMTRTVRLTFRIDSGGSPPAGTPVDIAIHTD